MWEVASSVGPNRHGQLRLLRSFVRTPATAVFQTEMVGVTGIEPVTPTMST